MRKQTYLIAIFFFSILAGCKKDKNCACNSTIIAADKYIYPVKAGSAEWNAAGTWVLDDLIHLTPYTNYVKCPPTY